MELLKCSEWFLGCCWAVNHDDRKEKSEEGINKEDRGIEMRLF